MLEKFARVASILWIFSLVGPSNARAEDLDNPRSYGFKFAGAYVGGSLGIGFVPGTTTTTDPTGATTSTANYQWGSSPSYSAFAGYNLVSGNILYGIEAEILRGSLGAGALSGFSGFNSDLDYQTTLRARLGLLVSPSFLLYGKLGVSYASMTFTETATSNTASSTFYGLTAGVGAEWKMNEKLSLRLDYDYNTFTSAQVAFPDATNTFQPSYHMIRLGFSYKF